MAHSIISYENTGNYINVYQDNSSCRSNESIKKPSFKRQPTAGKNIREELMQIKNKYNTSPRKQQELLKHEILVYVQSYILRFTCTYTK